MILSKSLLYTRKSFLSVLKNHKLDSSSIHLLSAPILKHRAFNAVIAPEICNIIHRFQSTQSAKDTILHLPKDEHIQASTSQSVNDGLPDVPVQEENIIASSSTDESTFEISELPDIVPDAVIKLNKLGEPTLESLDLGCSYTPAGWVQKALEFVHVEFNLPWWASITVCVIIARLCMFPLVIKSQRNSVRMSNAMPEMQEIQVRMQNARTYGNHIEMMKAGQDLSNFMKENHLNPTRSLMLPMIQAPIFLSFFLGLRKMAYTPVESMAHGGMLWFTDLTVMDQFYLLPLITCTTLWITLEVGADFSKIPSASVMSRYMSYGIKVIPLVVFPFIMHFPAAICVYWAATNMMSLTQVAFLKIPAVRTYFQIDQKKKHDPSKQAIKKGVFKDMKGAYGNMKIAREISERERLDEIAFKRAGRVPPAKTYKYDPTVNKQIVEVKKA